MGEEKNTAILVINLLVDMVERGRPFPMPPEYKAILQRTVSFIQAAHQAGYPVIFIPVSYTHLTLPTIYSV